jgi:hypothetical protein
MYHAPDVVEKFLNRRIYFESMSSEHPEETIVYHWCQQHIDSLKNILVCLYGTSGSIWNRYGNVRVFEEINRLSREVLIRTKDVIQKLATRIAKKQRIQQDSIKDSRQQLEGWGTLNALGQPAEPICTYYRCHHKFSLHGSRSCRCRHPMNKTLGIQVRYL